MYLCTGGVIMKNISKMLTEKKYFAGVLATWLVLSLVLGCTYGKIRNSHVESSKIHEFIDQNYGNCQIAYSGEKDKPGAIRFDLKDDDILLTGEGWHPIENRAQLYEMVENMNSIYRRYRGVVGALGPQLFLILDKNDKTIGYLFSPISNIPVRPDGANYSIDPVSELDVRKQVYPQTLRSKERPRTGN